MIKTTLGSRKPEYNELFKKYDTFETAKMISCLCSRESFWHCRVSDIHFAIHNWCSIYHGFSW
jgi:hypothetical protein